MCNVAKYSSNLISMGQRYFLILRRSHKKNYNEETEEVYFLETDV